MRYASSSSSSSSMSSFVFLRKLASLRNTTVMTTITTEPYLCTIHPSSTAMFVTNRYNSNIERRQYRYHHHHCHDYHTNNSKALFATKTITACHRPVLLLLLGALQQQQQLQKQLQQQYNRPLLLIRYQSHTKHEQQQQHYKLQHNERNQGNARKPGCIQQIEEMIDKVTPYYQEKYDINLLDEIMDPSTFTTNTNCKMNQMIHPQEREVINIVRYLHQRIQSMKERNICLYCWFQQDLYCICPTIREQEQQRLQQQEQQLFVLPKYIQNIYIITHYKEIGLISDTMKLLYLLYPQHCDVVVGNVLLENQHVALQQMNYTLRQQQEVPITACNTTNTAAVNHTDNTDETSLPPIAKTTTLVLFPSKNAQTFASFYHNQQQQQQQHHHLHQQPVFDDDSTINTHMQKAEMKYDIIVIDATWEQARRLYNRHIVPFLSSSCGNIVNIQLSEKSLATLQQQNPAEEGYSSGTETRKWNIGQQIRPHPIPVREISTAHAVQLLLHDIIRSVDNHAFQDSTGSSDNETNNSLTLPIQEEQQQVFDQYHQLINDTALRQTGKEQWK